MVRPRRVETPKTQYFWRGKQLEHRQLAEKALGKPLPKGAQVHHVNEDPHDNTPENLVICPNKRYHALLHLRSDALKATRDPAKRKCKFCQEYDDLANMYARPETGKPGWWHRSCAQAYKSSSEQLKARRRYRQANRAEFNRKERERYHAKKDKS